MAVATTIFKSSYLATGAEQNNGLAQEGPPDRLVAKLPREAGYVPLIECEHAG
jgi:hypothetical protein